MHFLSFILSISDVILLFSLHIYFAFQNNSYVCNLFRNAFLNVKTRQNDNQRIANRSSGHSISRLYTQSLLPLRKKFIPIGNRTPVRCARSEYATARPNFHFCVFHWFPKFCISIHDQFQCTNTLFHFQGN